MRALSSQEELIVIGLLLDNPALYLSEVCQMISQITGILISPPTVCRVDHSQTWSDPKKDQASG